MRGTAAAVIGLGVLAAIACGSSEDSRDAAAMEDRPVGPIFDRVRDVGREASYDDCGYECRGYSECQDGIVTTWPHTGIPCDYWNGQCPSEITYVCQRGCRIDMNRSDDPYLDPKDLCEEWRPKHLGDPCTDQTMCDPQVATEDPWDGGTATVTNVYLQCDVTSGTCVPRDPPVASDYLAHCGLTAPFGEDAGWEYGYVQTDSCTGGVCLMFELETCVLQGCTVRCSQDGDCPPGAVCEWLRNWTPANAAIGPVCKPGPHNYLGPVLSCPPDGGT